MPWLESSVSGITSFDGMPPNAWPFHFATYLVYPSASPIKCAVKLHIMHSMCSLLRPHDLCLLTADAVKQATVEVQEVVRDQVRMTGRCRDFMQRCDNHAINQVHRLFNWISCAHALSQCRMQHCHSRPPVDDHCGLDAGMP